MKAMNFQDDIPSIPIDNSKDNYVLMFDLTSMQDATEKFTFRLEHVTELILMGKRMSSVAVAKFGVAGKNI